MARRIAATIPADDTASARRGTPFEASFASDAGTYLPRAREKSMRVVRYRSVLQLESAAVITTMFIIVAAKGMPAEENARTNGLAVRPVPAPVWFQGVIASMTVMART